MRTSTIFVLMVLLASSVSLIVTPALASDYILDIFGNANMDDTMCDYDEKLSDNSSNIAKKAIQRAEYITTKVCV